MFAISYFALPPEFTGIFEDSERVVKNWHLFFCVACGLWGGLIIGIATEYFTSNRYQPVQVLLGTLRNATSPSRCCCNPTNRISPSRCCLKPLERVGHQCMGHQCVHSWVSLSGVNS